ncbi:ICAM5 protein, partial [Pterocles burchelli]|nr:ICAM5 protein [Pterocles burchelli]
LACAANGNPPPRVTCAKVGDTGQRPPKGPHSTRPGDSPHPNPTNVTRAHAGTYLCRATNAHGSALRNVTVAVECECWGRYRGF